MANSKEPLGDRIQRAALRARRAFFKLSMREKSLLLLFAVAIVALWFSWQLDRQKSLIDEHRRTNRETENQLRELGEEPRVREFHQQLLSRVDVNALPTKDEVSGQIDALVRRFNFNNFDLSAPRTQAGSGLDFHTFQLVVQKATYENVKAFTEAVRSELPYVALERVIIQAQQSDDRFLDVRFVFKSIENTQ